MQFIGRERELLALEHFYHTPEAGLMILFGRSRIGKTRLLTYFLESRQISGGFFWMATTHNSVYQLRDFSQALFRYNPRFAAAPSADFTFPNWEAALNQLADIVTQFSTPQFVVIDEFTSLLRSEPALAGLLQRLWDHRLSGIANLRLVLTGSLVGMMEREVISYHAPLYGRATAYLHLQPLPFGLSRASFPRFTAADRVALYAMLGGIPAYWEQVDPNGSIEDNIQRLLLTPNGRLIAEPHLVLQDFFTKPHSYWTILAAIASGTWIPREIAAYTGLPHVKVLKYLRDLRQTGLIERGVSVITYPDPQLRRHQITDPYLRFYFRFLSSRQDPLELGIQEPVLSTNSSQMADFIGAHTWKELCQEWLIRAGGKRELPLSPDDVGSAWNAQEEVGVAGISWIEKTLVLGECRWTGSPVDADVLVRLVEEKARKFVPAKGDWRVFFLGFSRSGWTDAALQYQKAVEKHRPEGANWRAAGMRLVDLAQLDQDLERWLEPEPLSEEEIPF